MKQIFEAKDLIGKTIVQTIIPESAYGDVCIKFSDNSFVVFKIDDRTEGLGNRSEVIVIDEYEKDNTDEELITLGLITDQDYELAKADSERKYQQRVLDREIAEEKRIEELEKQQLLKLKSKYENK